MAITEEVLDRVAPVIDKQYGLSNEEKDFVFEVFWDIKDYKHWVYLENKLTCVMLEKENYLGNWQYHLGETIPFLKRIKASEWIIFHTLFARWLISSWTPKSWMWATWNVIPKQLYPLVSSFITNATSIKGLEKIKSWGFWENIKEKCDKQISLLNK